MNTKRRMGIAATAGAIALLATACNESSSDGYSSYGTGSGSSYQQDDTTDYTDYSSDTTDYSDYSDDGSGSNSTGGGVDPGLDSDGNGRWNPSPLDPYAN